MQNPLPCVPCQQEGCERHLESHSQCLDELTPRQVLEAVDQALGARHAVARRRKRRYGKRPCLASALTPRQMLIVAHDLLATAAAIVASFFIRFEAGGLAERLRRAS